MEESAEIRATMIRYFDAIANGNVDEMKRLFAQHDGVLLIGTDPNEWWPGYDKAVSIWQAQFDALGGGFPIKSTNLLAYSEGSVGWAADQPVFITPEGELPFRLTTILHKGADGWKIVQSHASIGIANEDALGQELPT